MRFGVTYDLRSDYRALGYGEEETAEFDAEETIAAICDALAGLGHTSIAGVRQGKFFEITLEPGTDRAAAGAEIEQIARDVLANPVIEEYQVEFVD